MDLKALKEVLKPILKESIREVLREEGLLQTLQESKTSQSAKKEEIRKQIGNLTGKLENKPAPLNETLKRMKDELKGAGLINNRFDPFAGTKALTEAQATDGTKPVGPLAGRDPNDKGVDISGIMGMAAGRWKAHMGGKGK